MSENAIHHLSQDIRLQPVLASVSLPPLQGGARDLYAALVRVIISQQLSGKAADTIYQRFLSLFSHEHPNPDQLLLTTTTQLRRAGLSRQKAGYVHNIARFFQEEAVPKRAWASMEDEEVIRTLTRIKGVGRWTAEMILIFTLHRPDILPLGDLGIRKAMTQLYELDNTLPQRKFYQQLTDIAEPWRPYRSYACRLLWRWIDQR